MNWQVTIVLRSHRPPDALGLTEGFFSEFEALVEKWHMQTSSFKILAGQIDPIIQSVLLEATPEPRRSKRLASKPIQLINFN